MAQPDQGWIGINGGLSFPLGAMANNTGKFETNGYANNGLNINLLDICWSLKPNFGITGNMGFSIHQINEPKIGAQYGYSANRVSADSWNTSRILVGGYWMPKADLPIYARVMIGAVSVISPRIRFGDNESGLIIPTTTNTTFAYSFGVGGYYPISDYLGLSANIDYYGATLNSAFTTSVVDYRTAPITHISTDTKFKLNINTINFNLGLCFRFIK